MLRGKLSNVKNELLVVSRKQLYRWLLVGLLLLGLALRVIGLDHAPPGLRYDELQNYLMINRVLAGERPIYFTESWGHEPLFHYVQAAVMGLLTESGWSMRLPAVFSGMVAIVGVWLVGRRLFGPGPALVAAAAQTVSFWAIFYSRVGLRLGTTVPFFCFMALFLWLAVTQTGRRGWLAAVGSGLLLGGMIYVYPSARMGPVFVVAFAFYLLVWQRGRFREVWPRLLFILLLGGLVAAPLLNYLYQNPSQEQRGEQLAAPVITLLEEGNPRPLLEQVVRAAGMFVWQGEEDWLYNVAGRPIFEPVSALFFLAGVLLAGRRWRQPAYAFVLLWLLVGMMPTVATLPAASITHSIAAQPAAHILLALWLVEFASGLASSSSMVAPDSHPLAYFRFLLPGVVLAAYGYSSGYAYFEVWNREAAVRELYQGGVTAVVDDLRANSPTGPVVIGGPYINYWHPWNAVAFELTNPPDGVAVRWFNPAGAWLWPAGEEAATYYFPADPLAGQGYDPLLNGWFQDEAMAVPAANGDLHVFRVENWDAFEQERDRVVAASEFSWPAELAELPAAEAPLLFGGRFALLGAEVAEGTVLPGGTVRLLTFWRVEAADPGPVVAFAHVSSDGVDIWGQQDWLDVRAEGLRPGDQFVQVHTVTLKPETPPGRYVVQLGLYAPDTGVRLPIAAGEGQTADRVLVGEVRVEQ
jgi:4-amino-4-deoxy-L-arabinose transferase-like glycosyltransferase